MLIFGEVTITGYSVDSYVLSWVVAADPAVDDISDYKYHIYRSLSPEGPFDRVTSEAGLSNIFFYEDTQVNRFQKWRRWFYKIVARSTTGRSEVSSQVVDLQIKAPTQIELVAAEIRRNQNILLRGIGVTPGTIGLPCLLYIRRKFGTRCSCWSDTQQQVTDDGHLQCFGTGYVGGFMDPVLVYVNMGGETEQTDMDPNMEEEPVTGRVWTTNYPEMSYGDLIVTKDIRIYEVVRKTRTQLRDITSRQLLDIRELPRTDVRFKIPLNTQLLESAR